MDVPGVVSAAKERAAAAGFKQSCEDGVGQLLATLAGGVPEGGRVLELGTGAGVGLAWLVAGVGERTDVEVVSVEVDEEMAAVAAGAVPPWPPFVRLVHGDALDVLASLGGFDLVFADAEGGKWEGLPKTVAALRSGGVLVVDDMRPQPWWGDGQRRKIEVVRRTLLHHADLHTIELDLGSGVVLATCR